MNTIIAFAAILAVASASVLAPLAAFSVPASSQFHAQDELGQYTYGYSNYLSAKAESRSLDGSTTGSYSYVDPDGKVQSVEYTSDAVHGFRVAASNLPVAPAVPEVPALVQPTPVQDTPEVVEARAKHLAAVEEAKVRAIQVDAVPTVVSNSVEAKSVAAPAVVAPAITAAPLAPVQHLAFRSGFLTPSIAYRTAPVSAFGYSYNINGLYGYNNLYTYPGFTAYSVPFASQVFTTPSVGQSVEVARSSTATQEDNRSERSEQ
ncbi:unnamed protein product [Phaedon cochleariae]|uniref:Cuticle protein n=1 Tax=Phaedon cochleariae TaxID=80249 RepID=A0A9N9SN96_PHACE|nr:unnamed protein product [Phaedon cochleariae]